MPRANAIDDKVKSTSEMCLKIGLVLPLERILCINLKIYLCEQQIQATLADKIESKNT